MNRICKVILAAAAVTAFAAPAMATDKLIVKGTDGITDVFKVDDAGTISGNGLVFNATSKRLGLGTLSPEGSFHALDTGTTAARGFISAQINSGVQAGQIVLRKARGIEGGLVPVQQNDNIAAIHGTGWDGATWMNSATFQYYVDGPVSVGQLPMAFYIATGPNNAGKTTRLLVKSSGEVGVSTLTPTQALEVNGGVRINTAVAKPTCSTTVRGTLWYTMGAGTAKDGLEVCAQAAGGTSAWRTLY